MVPATGGDAADDVDTEDEWNDPPLPDESDDRTAERTPWPSNGLASAAWAGWLAVAYGLVGTGRALMGAMSPIPPAVIGLLGVGLLVGVRTGGGDPRVWR
jgi:hypothetical protein